ncbi:alkaline phosphatase D family protein [Leeuwenhoekiella aestuarii]|nr:alkaline phosphatase D family protein [Leeuwenhoekiella aestuarii]
MKKIITIIILLAMYNADAQITIPGDSLVYGPMFSPVYQNKVRVWVLTKDNTGSASNLTLSMTSNANTKKQLEGTIYNSDDRHLVYTGFETGDLDSETITREEDYNLRSYEFNIASGETYTAKLLENGKETGRIAVIQAEQDIINDFTFLAGGCGRIFDLSRCIDQWESKRITNGDPAMYDELMAKQDSDLMVWLGDAVYLLGEEHAHGGCPESFKSDWDNEEQAFKRYLWYRKYYDKLLQAMPQLAITDNHDTGSNEFDKTLPGLPATRKIFKDWWPNPEYKNTVEGEGLFSSYRYKDVEFFLTDNRSYRNNIKDQFGDEQLEWLEQALLNSTATFKIIVNGTPSFRELGGRIWGSSKRAPHLLQFIRENKINGVLSYSADLHQQRFMLREKDTDYPLIDVVSGNLNSDAPETDKRYANYKIDYSSEFDLLRGSLHAFLRTSVYGKAGNRRMLIEFVNGRDEVFFSKIIHQNTLTSSNSEAKELELNFRNKLIDESPKKHTIKAVHLKYGKDSAEKLNYAGKFSSTTSLRVVQDETLDFHNKSFTVTFKLKPKAFKNDAILLSNAKDSSGITFGISDEGKLNYKINDKMYFYQSDFSLSVEQWSEITWKYNNLRLQLQLFYNGNLIQTWEDVHSSEPSNEDITIGQNYEGLIESITIYSKFIN